MAGKKIALKLSLFITIALACWGVGLLALPAPQAGVSASRKLETATFAAGCFWGTEEFFRKIPGVVETRVGYTGGTKSEPKYEDLHGGKTGHAESVEVKFDPERVKYEDLLELFFKMHDPTTPDRQGNDVGSQYRSAIFYHNEKQKQQAEAFKAKVEKSKAWRAQVVTEIKEAQVFWPAEMEHQKYLQKLADQGVKGYDNHYLRDISFAPKVSK